MRVYYAQNKEDLLIRSFFPDIEKGFYVDIGANDPVIDSVTKLFYDSGWRGINVDPIKRHINSLEKARPGDINLQIGIGDKKGELTFTEYLEGHGISTFSDDSKQQNKTRNDKATIKHKDYIVTIKTLKDIVTEFNVKHIHFLKIDVEGYEYEVLKGYDWKNPRPELICIEANHIFKDWRPIIEKKSYSQVFFDGINNYYLAKESIKRKTYFDYAIAALAGPPVYYPTHQDIVEATELLAKEKQNVLRHMIAEKEQEVNFLHNQQRDVRFLLKRLNEEIQIRLNRRANSYKTSKSLQYQPDVKIKAIINDKNASAVWILNLVHKRDKENIGATNKLIASYFKVGFWKIAAKFYRLSVKIARKTVSL